MQDNKEIMSKNLKKYMEIKHVNATDVCNALNIKHNTFSDWVNGKNYPRIDKIEMLANYFGISKADLVERNSWDYLLYTQKLMEQIQERGKKIENDSSLIEIKKQSTLYERYKNANPETQEIIRRLLLLKEGDV